MLSFTAIGEVTIGEFSASPHRQAPITGVSATGAISGLSLGADQAFATPSLAATGAVGSITSATVDADANVTPTGVVGTSAAGAADGIGFISTSPTGVAGTSAVTAIASVNVSDQLSTLVATGAVGIGVSADAQITLPTSLGTTSVSNSKYNIGHNLTGVAGTGAAGWRDSDPDIPNGVFRAPEKVFLNTEFRRTATVNIVPYKEYKVYISR
jgi:hypothetical protein